MERRLKIITADERMAQDKGVKALVVGPAGVGKTTLLRTLDTKSTLFVDLEAGDLAVQRSRRRHVPAADLGRVSRSGLLSRRSKSGIAGDVLSTARRITMRCVETMGSADALEKYSTYFIDSITVAGRLCFGWCEQQPESLNDRGKKNLLGTYGLMGREMIAWLTHLQHTRGKNVFFVGILENLKDEFNVTSWQLQIDGSKTGKELPGIVDEIVTLQFVDFGDGNPVRALICTQPNQWQYPAKDRSGKLDLIEEPHLGKLLAKIGSKAPRHAVDHTIPQPTTTTEAAE